MEIFMRNIPAEYDRYDVKSALAVYLHGPELFDGQVNFDVFLHRPRSETADRTGGLTVHDPNIGQRFLSIYGGMSSLIWLDQNLIKFEASRFEPRADVLHMISRVPWTSPDKEREEEEERERGLSETFVPLKSVQFGWMCRDDVFSIESEARQPAHLRFDFQRRELNVIFEEDDIDNPDSEYVIAIRQPSIMSISSHLSDFDQNAVIFLQLEVPPSFFNRPVSCGGEKTTGPFQRLETLYFFNNPLAIPHISLTLRLIRLAPASATNLTSLVEEANLRKLVKSYPIDVSRRDLFSRNQLQAMDINIRSFDWCVAFQLEALVRNLMLDATEILEIIPKVRSMVQSHGRDYVAKLLREFGQKAGDFLKTDAMPTISSCFDDWVGNFAKEGDVTADIPTDVNFYSSLHATITPTSMYLEGPFVEKSNRVIRRYDSTNQDNFLRVEFRDEDKLQFRFGKDVDGAKFIESRLGPIMGDGLVIAGRKFRFLAYSQSALKEHSVWFVKPFRDSKHGVVTAEKIIDSLGSFSDLAYDRSLMYCPARYGARIAQAFSATDVAVVNVDEVLIDDDIMTADKMYAFTDGSGDMSEDLAREIWQLIRGKRNQDDFPHAYQIRFQGSKGMLSIDYTLNGSNTISLRDSMIKFDAPDSMEIEISAAFDKPTPYYLNRPLITILEHRGVPYKVFQDLQNEAVKETQKATRSLSSAAHLLQTHGLGASFKLHSTMLSIARLDLDALVRDPLFDGPMKLAVYHALRDLKYRARIPVPNAWTLVGVADTHEYLEEGQVFICIKHPDKGTFYLEGPILISRSPTIHPGDVQIARAIGGPPPGSCFAKEPLPNTVVFSVKGKRPLPTCLGGGDLDGDLYNILPLKDHPGFNKVSPHDPADYFPAKKQTTLWPATMSDVADFVRKFILYDVVGLVAVNWLIIADQERSITHPDCLLLAKLHSNAVDYQKTGCPVNINSIPRPRFPRPDWSAPETFENTTNQSHRYYESMSALGKLSRAINLKAHEPPVPTRIHRRVGDRTRAGRVESVADDPSSLDLGNTSTSAIFDAVEPFVLRLLGFGAWNETQISNLVSLTFRSFAGELENTAARFSLSHHRSFKPLSEEELIVGTITQKTSNPTFRKDNIAKMKDATELAFRRVKGALEGGEDRLPRGYLKYAWIAWQFSITEMKKGTFGSRAFWWISLGLVFDAMKVLEEDDLSKWRSTRSQAGWSTKSS